MYKFGGESVSVLGTLSNSFMELLVIPVQEVCEQRVL